MVLRGMSAGCYAIRTRCYRYGFTRQESEQAMSGSAPSSWPLPPGPVQNRRQPWTVPPRETHFPARPLAGPNFRTAPTYRPPRNKGNKQPNSGASFQIQQLVEMLAQICCSTEVVTEVRKSVSGLASPGDTAADKQRKLGDLLDRQCRAQSRDKRSNLRLRKSRCETRSALC